MEKTSIFTGKTMEVAVQSALDTLGLTREEISVQVLEQAKSGFLGIGATPCKVQVTYEAPDLAPETNTAPRSAFGSASRSKPKAVKKPEAPKQEAAPVAPKTEKKEAPKAEKKEAAPKQETAPKVYTPAAPGSVEERIEIFLKGLLEHMGSQAVPHCVKENEDTYSVELTGEDLGYLIGRRGDTLDALQHLANYSVNRSVDGHIRINVDAESYRAKREDSLRRYALKKAQQVLKAHRRTTLEPMNAYERHVIHAALQDTDRITTYSIGSEPNRRVVIEYQR
ncbi:MAG: Jag N-terminal domain-containing protein [Oscillospiraceae bacterium]|nr:Jag N-terminal domain-containing protein [Oscillospiraceae bacterium]